MPAARAASAPPAGGVVSAATPEAARAGAEILEAGGNAVDAAVATAFALTVSEPAGSGLGGQSTFIVHPHRSAPFVINGTSFSPQATPRDAAADLRGHRLTTVPSTVKVLDHAWRHHGSGRVTWKQLLAPAIRVAEEGFRVGAFRQRALLRHASQLGARPVARGLFLRPDGSAPAIGETWRQPVLARTLRRLAEAGADDFYTGEIARGIAEDMRRHDGWLTARDLAEVPPPRVAPPLRTTYRGWDVHSLPPPAAGWVVLQILKLLEQAEPRPAVSPDRLVTLAEALRIGHANRKGDPEKSLLDYQADMKGRISAERARELWRRREGGGETTHFSIVDASGMAVGVTQSLNGYFGCFEASPRLGFLYNDYMKEFVHGQPGHPFAIGPAAMPYSSMSASVLSRDGEVGLVLGSPGSARIISAVAQVVSHWVDLEADVERAVAAERLHVDAGGRLYAEGGALTPALKRLLESRGFELAPPEWSLAHAGRDPYFGGVHAVAREGGRWRGAADPRRDGLVLEAGPPAR